MRDVIVLSPDHSLSIYSEYLYARQLDAILAVQLSTTTLIHFYIIA